MQQDMQIWPEDMSLSFAIFAMQMVLSLRHCECNVAGICVILQGLCITENERNRF